MKKPVNYLAPRHEQNASLKTPFQEKIEYYKKLTQKIRLAWQTLLPDEAILTLQAVYQDNHKLVIVTDNLTLSNHLNYSKKPLLQTLQQFDSAFNYVHELKFQVNQVKNPMLQQLQCKNSVNSVTSRELSESTKQNIAHLAELVTHNKALHNALQKLLDE
nr:hypothetical protein [uncultured Moraxella sp.]